MLHISNGDEGWLQFPFCFFLKKMITDHTQNNKGHTKRERESKLSKEENKGDKEIRKHPSDKKKLVTD